MKVSEIGEFGLIDVLAQIVTQGRTGHPVLLGVGDDAAAWRMGDSILLATTDTMVQGVHFTAESSWRELGWKSLAINLSDIAAMGGVPQYALVSLCLPGDTEVDDVVHLYLGMMEVADLFQVAAVGGNVSRAPVVMITMAVVGVAQAEGVLIRSAAAPGDLIAVTGYLGSSAAGLRMLTHHLKLAQETMVFLRRAHLQPMPRIVEGQLLVKQGVRAAIDISDGLIADLGHVCKASEVGAVVRAEQVPIHPTARAAFPEESLGFALAGGEDYELLFTASQETIDRVRSSVDALGHGTDCPVTVIGEVTREMGLIVVDKNGRPFGGSGEGWDHFRKGG